MNINPINRRQSFYAILLLSVAVWLPISCRAQTASEKNDGKIVNASVAPQDCLAVQSEPGKLPAWKENPLHTAIVSRDLKTVKKLLAENSGTGDIAAYGDTPLTLVLDRRIPEAKELAAEKNRNFVKEDETFRLEIIKQLFKRGANANTKNSGGETSLIKAARVNYENNHQLKVLKLLISNKAEVNAADERGMTALMRAAENGKNSAVKYLLENGADRSLKNCAGQTALIIAQTANQTEAVQILQSKL